MAASTETAQVVTSQWSWEQLVREQWGEAWAKPEVVYRFSDGREFLNYDESPTTGFYV